MTIAELRRNINSDTQASTIKTKKETHPSADTLSQHPLNKNHNHPQYAHSATKLKRKNNYPQTHSPISCLKEITTVRNTRTPPQGTKGNTTIRRHTTPSPAKKETTTIRNTRTSLQSTKEKYNHPQDTSTTKCKRKNRHLPHQVPRTPPVISPSDNTDAFIRAQVSGIPSLHTTHHSNERLPRIKQKCRRHPSASSQENSSGGNTLHRHQGEQSPSAHRGYHRLRSLYQQKQSGTHRRAPHFVVLILSPPLSFLPAAGGSTSLPQ